MAKVGRKSKYTPDVVERIVQAIQLGSPYNLACQYAGISHETFHQWINNKPEFSEAVKEAEGKAVVGWLAKIEKAATSGSWQAAAWKLERRYFQEFGQRARLDINIKQEVERLAAELGLDPKEVLQEAVSILKEGM
jgi:transposase